MAAFVLFTPFIRAGPVSIHYYYCTLPIFASMFVLGTKEPIFLYPLNLSSFLLLFFQCLSRFVAFSYHYLILLGNILIPLVFA